MMQFFDRIMKPTIFELFEGRYRFTRIQERYTTLAQEVVKRYGKPYNLNMSPTAAVVSFGENTVCPVGYEITENGPQVNLFVPVFMQLHAEFQTKYPATFVETFDASFVVGLIHELDHAVKEYRKHKQTPADFIISEKNAWGETCAHTIVPMIEQYNMPVSEYERFMYDNWVRCGRSITPAWHSFINTIYRGGRHLRKQRPNG